MSARIAAVLFVGCSATDVFVGGTPNGRSFDRTLDFLRIAHGTPADADTTIEALYAWEFDGPQMRDFADTSR